MAFHIDTACPVSLFYSHMCKSNTNLSTIHQNNRWHRQKKPKMQCGALLWLAHGVKRWSSMSTSFRKKYFGCMSQEIWWFNRQLVTNPLSFEPLLGYHYFFTFSRHLWLPFSTLTSNLDVQQPPERCQELHQSLQQHCLPKASIDKIFPIAKNWQSWAKWQLWFLVLCSDASVVWLEELTKEWKVKAL